MVTGNERLPTLEAEPPTAKIVLTLTSRNRGFRIKTPRPHALTTPTLKPVSYREASQQDFTTSMLVSPSSCITDGDTAWGLFTVSNHLFFLSSAFLFSFEFILRQGCKLDFSNTTTTLSTIIHYCTNTTVAMLGIMSLRHLQ